MIVRPEDPNSVNELVFQAMNTSFYVSISNSSIKNWKGYIVNWFEYVEREWSRFRSGSELDSLNMSKIGETILLSQPLFDVLMKAEAYRQKTNGLFSPYLMNHLTFHGYDRSFPFDSAEKKDLTDFDVIGICPFAFNLYDLSVTRAASGNVDLGGIGKGYAVESAACWLKNNTGAEFGIVDGGGDITVWSNGSKGWEIGIADPLDQKKELKQISLKNGSAATSNTIFRSWMQGGQKKHHILNGKTGMPVLTDIIQSTVVTTSCLDAEVCAKLCFMEEGEELNKRLSSINSNSKYVLVHQNGELLIH